MGDNEDGRWSKTMQAAEEIQAKCDQLKHVIEAAEKKAFKVFKAADYQYQFVCGTNYIVKIFVRQDHFSHVMFLETLPTGGWLLLIKKRDKDPLVPV